MVFKSKLFVLLAFGIAVLAAGVLAATLSEDIFPSSLEGISLTSVEEELSDDEIAEGFSAYYESEEKEIDVFFWRMRSASIAKSVEQDLIPAIKEEYALLFDEVDWESSKTASVAGYQSTAIRFRVYLGGDYLDGGFIFAAVKDYLILIQAFGYEKPSFSELERVLEIFINKIPENGSPLPPPGEQEEEYEYWTSEKFQEVKNQDMVEKIYEDQNSYKEEFVEAYEMIEGGIAHVIIKDAKLDVKLEVQGNTAGKIPKVNEGDEVEVRLEIENDSRYNLALVAGIFYPGYDAGVFELEEKKYTISFEWDGGLSSLIGSFKTKLIGGKFVVMPPGSKLYVYSKVVPEQTGYLDVQGLIYYTTEKKYQEYDIGFLDEAPKAYQESEVSETILVEQRPCDWWPICL
ncbi:hypothetical protein KJ841_01520 [Patescibacteria group bacterium]|nr:hypothetical protein [Patescibacteria group bacterium]